MKKKNIEGRVIGREFLTKKMVFEQKLEKSKEPAMWGRIFQEQRSVT